MIQHPAKGEMSLRTALLVAGVLALMTVIVFTFDYFLLKNRPAARQGVGVSLYDLLLNTNASPTQNTNIAVSQDPPIDSSWTIYESTAEDYTIAYPSSYAVREQEGRLEIYQPTKQLDEPVTVRVIKDQLLEDRKREIRDGASSQTVKETTLDRSFAPLALRLEVQEANVGTVVYHLYVSGGWIYELRETGVLESIINTFRLK